MKYPPIAAVLSGILSVLTPAVIALTRADRLLFAMSTTSMAMSTGTVGYVWLKVHRAGAQGRRVRAVEQTVADIGRAAQLK